MALLDMEATSSIRWTMSLKSGATNSLATGEESVRTSSTRVVATARSTVPINRRHCVADEGMCVASDIGHLEMW